MYGVLDGKEVGFAGSDVAANISGIDGEEVKGDNQWGGAEDSGSEMRIMESVNEC